MPSPTFTDHRNTWPKSSIENSKYVKFSAEINVSQGWKPEQTRCFNTTVKNENWNTYDKELSSEMTAVNENLNIWLTFKETWE